MWIIWTPQTVSLPQRRILPTLWQIPLHKSPPLLTILKYSLQWHQQYNSRTKTQPVTADMLQSIWNAWKRWCSFSPNDQKIPKKYQACSAFNTLYNDTNNTILGQKLNLWQQICFSLSGMHENVDAPFPPNDQKNPKKYQACSAFNTMTPTIQFSDKNSTCDSRYADTPVRSHVLFWPILLTWPHGISRNQH